LLPGALGNEDSSVNESFAEMTAAEVEANSESRMKALLDFPHYTRPAEFRGWSVPGVLIGGNHAEVAKWRRAAAVEKTKRMRPELIGEVK
ncbi:MAG: tRNA (guanosine(37)-N1)-methyltransferase TrmD, partial [Acidobacteria bacterium]|nr:tRNA (guanosine(37)-N1)-methyltransferase TrmD [Acidobacteriota bacterium]